MPAASTRKPAPAAEAPTELSPYEKAFRSDVEWSKTELKDVLFWLLSGLSLVSGLICGVLGLTGYVGFISYFVTSFSAMSYYIGTFLQLDADDFGGKAELLQDAYTAGLGVFLTGWICMYTLFHGASAN
ncbi:hypothetical protein H4R33_005541 [Dimargaris cristalligena]|uniref:Rab5-interacting protein-domain-containing protein n=1 Tax=Dimargaris cristalligena TaxID=215637 RepID=A0A4Q0A244_9FUNG|nr:hypothetical protein H4R33_005541 [Dimargaris cristalligena]RKP39382.1 Rab5-interacting protein-domain-containing protein [Dimargaris cristalligena]|eukprot:RKP39382.1 Rab5-interacting protein-domain-containing protein [Dimargaris cristalligena]